MMKEKIIKYILLTTLIVQVTLLGYLSIYFFINEKVENYTDIKVSGNKLLSEEQYISLITSEESNKEISLNYIKTKLESHPYVLNADVLLNSINVLEISIEEKQLYSIIIKNSEPYFVTNDFELIKIFPFTNSPALPLIVMNENLNSSIVKNEQIIVAFKVIDTLRELNQELLERLTEINLSDKKNLVLLFKNINAPVLMNKTNIVKELVSLSELMNLDNSIFLDSNTRYIDLRFNNQIIIG
jgi:cell division septal protein FtsQ